MTIIFCGRVMWFLHYAKSTYRHSLFRKNIDYFWGWFRKMEITKKIFPRLMQNMVMFPKKMPVSFTSEPAEVMKKLPRYKDMEPRPPRLTRQQRLEIISWEYTCKVGVIDRRKCPHMSYRCKSGNYCFDPTGESSILAPPSQIPFGIVLFNNTAYRRLPRPKPLHWVRIVKEGGYKVAQKYKQCQYVCANGRKCTKSHAYEVVKSSATPPHCHLHRPS